MSGVLEAAAANFTFVYFGSGLRMFLKCGQIVHIVDLCIFKPLLCSLFTVLIDARDM
jgi:hypothetical protein